MSQDHLLYIPVVISAYILIFSFLEGLFRLRVLKRESIRKIGHAAAGAFTMLLPFWISYAAIALTHGFLALVMFLLLEHHSFSSVTRADRATFGTVFMPMGIALTALLWPRDGIYIPAIGVVAFADSAAGIVGSRLRRKSWYGSMIFFLVSIAILFALIPNITLLHLILFSIVLTVVERFSSYGIDNLLLPLVAGVLLSLF